MATQQIPRLTEEEYLALDRANEFRSEFIDGEMLAMSGGSVSHAGRSSRCGIEFDKKLAGRNCVVLLSDARVRASVSGSYVYPDLSIICSEVITHQNMADIITNPILVLEVVSKSTRKYDYNRKFEIYREMTSLKEYLLVHPDSPKIEHYSRQPNDSWNFRVVSGLEASLTIPALAITIDLLPIYTDSIKLPT